MLVYTVGTVLSVFFAYISVAYERKQKEAFEFHHYRYVKRTEDAWQKITAGILRVISALPLILISGLRYRVGTDWASYAASFVSVKNGNDGYYSEKGYLWLQRAVALFTDDYLWLFFTCAVIFAVFYFGGIYRISVNPPMSVALIVCTSLFFSYMNGMRQGLALSVLFFSMRYVLARDWKHFLFFLIVASGFHVSSLAFVIIYFLGRFEINVKSVLKYTIFFSIVGTAGGKVVELLIMRTKYAHYYQSQFADEGFELLWFLISATILAVMCLYYENARKSHVYSQYNVFLWMQMLAVIFCLISASVPGANRIVWMFNTGQLLSLPLLAQLEEDRRWRAILIVLMVGFYALATVIALKRGSHRVLPYQTYFSVR